MIFSKKVFIFLAISSILTLAFLLRVYFSYEIVFSVPIKYASDDGVYHMRIVENELLGGHFPKRIYFDPYTNFPHGTYIHFAPLYDHLLAFSIWILTLGQPSQKAIDTIAPFYPPLLGTLVVLVVYFLGRILWGNTAGLIAAVIAAISPTLIVRSLLGATDHHVSEILFSSLAILSLFYLLKFQEKAGFYSPKWWILVILTGIILGSYFLVWKGALLFLFLFFVFFILYSIHEYLSGKPWAHLPLSGIVIFLIVFLFLFPYFLKPSEVLLSPFYVYNFHHLIFLISGLLSFLIILVLGKLFSWKKIKLLYFSISFFLIGLFLIIFLYFVSPQIFFLFVDTFKAVNTSFSPHENAKELTSEMRPTTIQGAIDIFSGFFFFSFLGLIIIVYQFIKKRHSIELLIIIWFLVTFFISGIFPSSIGQIKYIYYLWIVVALLSAFFLKEAFIFSWRGLKIIQEPGNKNSFLFPYALIGSLLTIFFILVFLFYPFPFNIGAAYPNNLPSIVRSTIGATKSVIQHEQDWYLALKWLRENTPTPSLDYYALYQEPGVDPKTKKIQPYNYPPDSYGVLARWDVGHAITYYAQRMPVSNPFHQGIGKKKNGEVLELGDGVFFLETEEEKATNYLDQLKVRYLITDSSYAHPDFVFKQIIKWVQKDLKGYTEEDIGEGPSKFDSSMIARLHILDGRGTVTERKKEGKVLKFEIKPLSHFRLIYESPTAPPSFKEEENIKMVKIFEYVKGAKIVGRTNPGTEVTLSTEITTNQARKFVYQKSLITKDGYFEFIVPYSTQTQFAVFARPYKIKIGKKEIVINISEEEILEGKIIEIKDI